MRLRSGRRKGVVSRWSLIISKKLRAPGICFRSRLLRLTTTALFVYHFQASKRKPFDLMEDEDDDVDDNLEENEDDDDDDDVSDFDDDDDPDKIEVPGGGRDLVTAMTFGAGSSGVASSTSGTSSGSTPTLKTPATATSNPSSTKPAVVTYRPAAIPPGGINVANQVNGRPVLSNFGIPILPVNTATTRVGGPPMATVRRGGYGGQPFTSA